MPQLIDNDQLALLVGARALGPAAKTPSKALVRELDALVSDVRDLLDANGDMIAAHLAGDDAALVAAAATAKGLVRRVQRRASTIAPHVATLAGLLWTETMTMLGQVLALAEALAPDPPPVEPQPEPEPEP